MSATRRRAGGRPAGPVRAAVLDLIRTEAGIRQCDILDRLTPIVPNLRTPPRGRLITLLHWCVTTGEIIRRGDCYYPTQPAATPPSIYHTDRPHPAVLTYRAEKAAASARREARHRQVMAECQATLAAMDANAPRSKNGHRQGGHSMRREEA